jgi:hypothetical protein
VLGQRIGTVLKQALCCLSGAYPLLVSTLTHHVVIFLKPVVPEFDGRLVMVIGGKTRMS